MTNPSLKVKLSQWPKSIDEVNRVLDKALTAKQKREISSLQLSELSSLDSTLGAVIRNEFGLLVGNDELITCTLEIDAVLASRTLVREYWDHLNYISVNYIQ